MFTAHLYIAIYSGLGLHRTSAHCHRSCECVRLVVLVCLDDTLLFHYLPHLALILFLPTSAVTIGGVSEIFTSHLGMKFHCSLLLCP